MKCNGTNINCVSVNNAHGTGFLKLNPLGRYHQQKVHNKHKALTSQYEELVFNSGPFAFFITLTFSWGRSIRSCCKYTSKFLKMYNERLFGQEYYKKESSFIKGFAFIEEHKGENSVGKKHIHMLVVSDKRYLQRSLTDHKILFVKAALKIKNSTGRRVFKKDCIDLRPYEDRGAISYCFKQINDKNLNRIKFIDKFGLTDDLDDI